MNPWPIGQGTPAYEAEDISNLCCRSKPSNKGFACCFSPGQWRWQDSNHQMKSHIRFLHISSGGRQSWGAFHNDVACIDEPRKGQGSDSTTQFMRNLPSIFLNCELLLHESVTYLALIFKEASHHYPLPLWRQWKNVPTFSHSITKFQFIQPKMFKCSIMVECLKARNIIPKLSFDLLPRAVLIGLKRFKNHLFNQDASALPASEGGSHWNSRSYPPENSKEVKHSGLVLGFIWWTLPKEEIWRSQNGLTDRYSRPPRPSGRGRSSRDHDHQYRSTSPTASVITKTASLFHWVSSLLMRVDLLLPVFEDISLAWIAPQPPCYVTIHLREARLSFHIAMLLRPLRYQPSEW